MGYQPGMDLSVSYRIEVEGQGLKAVRLGEIEAVPPQFVPGSGRKLSASQIAIRNVLRRRLGKIFTEELTSEGFVLPGNWEKIGRMVPVEVSCQRGWLVIAWKITP